MTSLGGQPTGVGQDLIPADWQRWRGVVDTRLENIEQEIEKLPQRVEERVTKVLDTWWLAPAKAQATHVPDHKNAVTFKWLVEKLLLPLMLAANAIILAMLLEHLIGK